MPCSFPENPIVQFYGAICSISSLSIGGFHFSRGINACAPTYQFSSTHSGVKFLRLEIFNLSLDEYFFAESNLLSHH